MGENCRNIWVFIEIKLPTTKSNVEKNILFLISPCYVKKLGVESDAKTIKTLPEYLGLPNHEDFGKRT